MLRTLDKMLGNCENKSLENLEQKLAEILHSFSQGEF